MFRAAVVAATVLSGCAPSTDANTQTVANLQKQLKAQRTELARLQNEIDIRQSEIDALRATYIPTSGNPQPDGSQDDSVATRAEPARKSVAMCYKDYCPCDPPQGGPDQVLCDQLEEGIAPDVQMMIAGRGMREARRQIETGDY